MTGTGLLHGFDFLCVLVEVVSNVCKYLIKLFSAIIEVYYEKQN